MNIKNNTNDVSINNSENQSIGEFLKICRENSGIEITKVANFLKVRVSDIKSLEENDIDKIAKNIYAKGLIKSYAKYLKINNNIIESKISELSLKSNVDIKKHMFVNIGEYNESSPSNDLVINSLIASTIIFLIFMMIFSSIENNVNSINSENIISDIKKIQD